MYCGCSLPSDITIRVAHRIADTILSNAFRSVEVLEDAVKIFVNLVSFWIQTFQNQKTSTFKYKKKTIYINKKNPAYRRHWIYRRVQIEAPGVVCHMSLTQTATATDPPPANSPTMHNRMGCKDPKSTFFRGGDFRPCLSQHWKLWDRIPFISFM